MAVINYIMSRQRATSLYSDRFDIIEIHDDATGVITVGDVTGKARASAWVNLLNQSIGN